MSFELHQGDCIEVMRGLPSNSVDSFVTDPPYHLTTGKKGGSGPASVSLESPYGRARVGTGFMGMTWDGGDIAQQPETWAECLRVAKPGAFLAAFGGTRTSHRMACAIEDAGWELRDTIMWVYGSGFPKSHNGEWGGTALKPAWEPIILARKPLIGTVAANYVMHGVGGLNIDGCRVAIDPRADASQLRTMDRSLRTDADGWGMSTVAGDQPQVVRADGRWPANLIHDGSDEVLAAFPFTASGTGAVKRASSSDSDGNTGAAYGAESRRVGTPMISHGDAGSAARFFYCAKADKEDREEGCATLAMTATAYGNQTQAEVKRGNTAHKGDNGLNTVKMRANHHATVKPTDLMAYLCRLVTPPGGTVLDPFMGSGSTGKAAVLEGFDFIGIDMAPEYVSIARARIEHAQQQGYQPSLDLEAATCD